MCGPFDCTQISLDSLLFHRIHDHAPAHYTPIIVCWTALESTLGVCIIATAWVGFNHRLKRKGLATERFT